MKLWHGILAGAIGFIAMGIMGLMHLLGKDMTFGPSLTLVIFGIFAVIYSFYIRDEGKDRE